MALSLKKQNLAKGDCDCCTRTDVDLTPSKFDSSMMMCSFCMADESNATATVETASKVIAESRQNDSKITHKEDVFTAVTTSFIELHGAILANDAIPAESKKYALADEVVARIKSRETAIFALKTELATLENERFGWIKNLQPLVATLHTQEQEKYKQFNVNYKPVEPGIVKIRKVAKSSGKPSSDGVSWTPNTPVGVKKPSNSKIREACDAANADVTMVTLMLNSSKNAELTLAEVVQKYLKKQAN